MRSRLVAGIVTLGVAAALVTVPVTPAVAADTVVAVGPEALLNGSTDIRLTKEYETVAPAVPGFRSPADHVYVEGPTGVGSVAAHGGSSLQLFTGAGKPNPGTNPTQVPVGSKPTLQGKDYVGRWFTGAVQPSRLSRFDYRALAPTTLAPYLSIEFYNPAALAGHQYVNLVWAPGVNGNAAATPGAWQDYDTTNGWATSATFVTGITAGAPISLAAALAALDADDDDPLLLRANVSWGDTGGGYANKSIYLDDITMTFDATTTTYAFDAPYSSTCVAPAGGWVRAAELADPTQWAVHTEYQPTVPSSASASIVTGPAGAAGGQSLQLASGPGTDVPGLRGYAGKVFVDRVLPGCTLADLTALSYRTFTAAGQSSLAPYLNIDVALPGNSSGAGESSILVWSPGDGGSPAPAIDAWSTWTPFTSGTWRIVRTITGSSTLTAGSYYTWAAILAAIPTAEMPRGVQLVVGDSTYQAVNGTGWSAKTLAVDSLAIGIGGTTSTFDFGNPFGSCPVDFDYPNKVATLTGDCTTSTTLYVPDGWTLDGDGHSITGLETAGTAFHGAILQNEGVTMFVRDLTITTNKDVWDDPSKNSGGDLVGIRFLAAAGSLDQVTVDGVSHGNGVQEGKAILIDNRTGTHNVQVTITRSTVLNYQKNGIDVRGAGATLELRDSVIGAGATPNGARIDTQTASNSLVVYGATAVVTGNTISGNDWDGTGDVPNTRDWNATGVLLYEAAASVFSGNIVDGGGTDVGIYSYNSAATITCNVVTRTADQPGRLDVWSTGITIDGGSASLAGNTVSGFRTPINGAVQSGSGGCLPGLPTVSASVDSARSATVLWGLTPPPLDVAPLAQWEVSVDGVEQTRDASVTSLALTGLAPGSHHNVAVRAINADGAGPWASTSFTTSTIPVPSPVTGLVAAAITRTSANVSWAANLTVGDGAVDSYQITVAGVPTVVGAGTLGRALTGLAPGTAYTVILRAHNESGWSNPTSVSFTTNDLDRRTPGAPSLVVGDPDGDGIVPMSWTPNAGDSADFPVQNWIVSIDGADEAFLPSSTRTYLVTGLSDGRHTVTVRGVNALGSTAFASQVLLIESQNASLPTASMTATPSRVAAGAASTLVGRFALDGIPSTDTVVTIWSRSGSSWTYVGTTVTDDEGQFVYGVRVLRTTLFRAIAAGLPSAYATVSVRPVVSVKVLTNVVKKRTLVRVLATVTPSAAGATVRLQKAVGRSWRTVATGRLSAASSILFKVGTVKALSARYRVLVGATAASPALTSAALAIKVKPRR